MLSSDKGVFGDGWRLLPPDDGGVILLEEEVGRRVLVFFVVDSVSDVGSEHVSVDGNEEFSRVVGVVVGGESSTSLEGS